MFTFPFINHLLINDFTVTLPLYKGGSKLLRDLWSAKRSVQPYGSGNNQTASAEQQLG